MTNNRLNIVTVSPTSSSNSPIPLSNRLTRKKELQAKFERLWLLNPDQFNPLRNCMERERLERTWNILHSHVKIDKKQVVDIGCAAGVFTRRLRDAGAEVTAVDIAENALKQLRKNDMSHILAVQDAMPISSLPDDAYDIVVCTEVIAELPRDDYRLFFSELNRIVKSDGWILCSTAVDIDSDDAAHQLFEFAVTELEILHITYSYHAFYLHLVNYLEAPQRFIAGWKNRDYCQKHLSNLKGISYWWYRINSVAPLAWFWALVALSTKPILKALKNSKGILLFLEKMSCFFGPETHISHVIFLARRRPLQQFDKEEIPIERPKKREIWE